MTAGAHVLRIQPWSPALLRCAAPHSRICVVASQLAAAAAPLRRLRFTRSFSHCVGAPGFRSTARRCGLRLPMAPARVSRRLMHPRPRQPAAALLGALGSTAGTGMCTTCACTMLIAGMRVWWCGEWGGGAHACVVVPSWLLHAALGCERAALTAPRPPSHPRCSTPCRGGTVTRSSRRSRQVRACTRWPPPPAAAPSPAPQARTWCHTRALQTRSCACTFRWWCVRRHSRTSRDGVVRVTWRRAGA